MKPLGFLRYGEIPEGATLRPVLILVSDMLTLSDDLVYALHLSPSEGCGHLVHPVVEAETLVRQPHPASPLPWLAILRHRRAISGSSVTTIPPSPVVIKGFAGVLDDNQSMPVGDLADDVQFCRLAEGTSVERVHSSHCAYSTTSCLALLTTTGGDKRRVTLNPDSLRICETSLRSSKAFFSWTTASTNVDFYTDLAYDFGAIVRSDSREQI